MWSHGCSQQLCTEEELRRYPVVLSLVGHRKAPQGPEQTPQGTTCAYTGVYRAGSLGTSMAGLYCVQTEAGGADRHKQGSSRSAGSVQAPLLPHCAPAPSLVPSLAPRSRQQGAAQWQCKVHERGTNSRPMLV